MRKPRRPANPLRRPARKTRIAFERLEDRTLLDASNIFAQFSGVVPAAGSVQQIPITLSTSNFTLPGSHAVIGFQVQAPTGSSLDPAAVTITTAAGTTVKPTYVNADLGGHTQSLALASLTYGSYNLTVGGQRGTSGAFQLDAFLAGDANGDHRIDLSDGSLIRSLIGSVSGDGRYQVAADSNLDGVISSFDYTQWRYNLNDVTSITPLALSLQTPPGLVRLPSGSLATASSAVTLRGTTNPGATVAIETGSDGLFDEGSTTADSSGNFSFSVSLAAGANNLQVKATDTFGQQQTAALAILLDTQPPTVTVTSPAPGLSRAPTPPSLARSRTTCAGWPSCWRRWTAERLPRCRSTLPAISACTTSLPLDDTADGPHTVHLRATDRVGNVSATTDFPFTLETCLGFGNATVAQSGGSPAGQGSVTISGCDATLREGDSFDVTLAQPVTIPSQASTLSFDYSNLAFDTTSQGRVKDAFEVALVDASGNSLVPTIAANRDAFLNITEGQPAALGAWATIAGQTVTLDVSHVTPGTAATLVFRLVNNDGDVNTSVDVGSVRVAPLTGQPVDPGGQPGAPRSRLQQPSTSPTWRTSRPASSRSTAEPRSTSRTACCTPSSRPRMPASTSWTPP